jgi:hypothetical protein
MAKPANLITTISVLLVALCLLAITLLDHFKTPAQFKSAVAQRAVNASPLFADAGLARNPPHGKPGHRHDLGDGALLPTTKTSLQTPGTSLNPVAAAPSTQAQALDGASSVALNPAHGQPGHVCGIAVGAPLSSAPATNAASPKQKAQLQRCY